MWGSRASARAQDLERPDSTALVSLSSPDLLSGSKDLTITNLRLEINDCTKYNKIAHGLFQNETGCCILKIDSVKWCKFSQYGKRFTKSFSCFVSLSVTFLSSFFSSQMQRSSMLVCQE